MMAINNTQPWALEPEGLALTAAERWRQAVPYSRLPAPEQVERLSRLPRAQRRFARREVLSILNRHLTNSAEQNGPTDRREREANSYLIDLIDRADSLPVPLNATDSEICDWANKTADFFRCLIAKGTPLYRLRQLAEQRGAADIDAKTEDGIYNRLRNHRFWRLKARRFLRTQIETIARNDLGMVSRRRCLYVSDDSFNRRKEQKSRNRALLKVTSAINQFGQEFTLEELAAVSVSNPAIRRAELMVRIAGFETIAREVGHVGEFVTITCPSRFHRSHSKTGRKNSKFDGSTPIDASRYLSKVWARILAKLARAEVRIYGFRVAEPHHDGTPHWHCLFFMPPDQVDLFRQTIARYACRENREELGLNYHVTKADVSRDARVIRADILKNGETPPSLAAIIRGLPFEAKYWAEAEQSQFDAVDARVKFKRIDWEKGSAAGYIAKYIAKNIDGETALGDTIGLDYEADGEVDAKSTAARVDAWASTWNIRQFQQIGGVPVGLWRELRRYDYIAEGAQDVLLSAAFAADHGDWARFVNVLGGWQARRNELTIKMLKEDTGSINQYGEPKQPVLRGVMDAGTGELAITRKYEWAIEFRGVSGVNGGSAAAWTCVNNSTITSIEPESTLLETGDYEGFSFFDDETFSGLTMPRGLSAEDYQRVVRAGEYAEKLSELSNLTRLIKSTQPGRSDEGIAVLGYIEQGLLPPSLAKSARPARPRQYTNYHDRISNERLIANSNKAIRQFDQQSAAARQALASEMMF